MASLPSSNMLVSAYSSGSSHTWKLPTALAITWRTFRLSLVDLWWQGSRGGIRGESYGHSLKRMVLRLVGLELAGGERSSKACWPHTTYPHRHNQEKKKNFISTNLAKIWTLNIILSSPEIATNTAGYPFRNFSFKLAVYSYSCSR